MQPILNSLYISLNFSTAISGLLYTLCILSTHIYVSSIEVVSSHLNTSAYPPLPICFKLFIRKLEAKSSSNFNFFVIIRLNVFKLHFILAWVNWVFKLWLTFLNLRVNISHLILIIAAVRSLIIATLLICRFRKTKIWVIAFKSTTEMPCSVMSPKIQKECIMGRCDLPHEWLLILNEVFALCFFDIRAWDHWWSRLNWIFNLVFIEMLTLSSIRELWYIWLILNWYWKCVLLQI